MGFTMHLTIGCVSVFFFLCNISSGFVIDQNVPKKRVPCGSADGYETLLSSVRLTLKRAHFKDVTFDVNAGGFSLAHIYPEFKISSNLYDYVTDKKMNELQELIYKLFEFDEDAYVFDPPLISGNIPNPAPFEKLKYYSRTNQEDYAHRRAANSSKQTMADKNELTEKCTCFICEHQESN